MVFHTRQFHISIFSIVFPIFHKTFLKRKHIYRILPLIWLFGPVEKTCFLAASSNVIDGKCVAGIFPLSHNWSFNFLIPPACYHKKYQNKNFKLNLIT